MYFDDMAAALEHCWTVSERGIISKHESDEAEACSS